MENENFYDSYEIMLETLKEGPKFEHKHTYFELIYIISGTGRHCINDLTFDYSEGNMFLITPQDNHSFEVASVTQFFFVRFSNAYINSGILKPDNKQQLHFILQNANRHPDCILKNQSDRIFVRQIVEALIRENVNRDIYEKELTQQLINTLIVVITRNIAKYLPDNIKKISGEKIMEILCYIQQNIYSPDKIRSKALCAHFGISENYLGKYFKKCCQETLQSYINNHRLTIIEHRLKYTHDRLTEIAADLGFADESHLHKFFKTRRGINPKAFRTAILNPGE